jgi:hypothetical protein
MPISLAPHALHAAKRSLAPNARRIRPLRSPRHLGPEPRQGVPLTASPRPPVPFQTLLETPAPCVGPQDAPGSNSSRAISRHRLWRLCRLAISLSLDLPGPTATHSEIHRPPSWSSKAYFVVARRRRLRRISFRASSLSLTT